MTHRLSGGALLPSETLAYDAASQLTSRTRDGVTTSFGYDPVGQLLSEVRSGYSASYTYDANGNRLTRTVNGSTETYSYDAGDKLTAISGGANPRTFGYDAAGRTTSVVSGAGTTTLTYDFDSRVTAITGPGVSSTFTYNGLDTRVGVSGTGGPRTFLRSGTYVTDPVLADGAATYTPGLSERRSGVSRFAHTTHIGTTERLQDASQATTDTFAFDAFGVPVSRTGSTATPFGYKGAWGYQADASGLMLLGHRYLDPSTGRFLTRDPIKDGRNWYAYGAGEAAPTGMVDPTGLIGSNSPANVPTKKACYEIIFPRIQVPQARGLPRREQVRANNRVGLAVQRVIIDRLKRAGVRILEENVYIDTPYGRRYSDLLIELPRSRRQVLVKIKSHDADYPLDQRRKDDYIRRIHRLHTIVMRGVD